jgi:excinuclease ABC subunit C
MEGCRWASCSYTSGKAESGCGRASGATWRSDHLESVKTRALMRQAVDVETIVVPTEAHALILEANLIKEYRPRFNIALRDDKSYPYIKVTVQEPFPRVFVTRRLVDDGAKYFGPYTDVGQMRRALNVVKRIFTVRSCNYDMPRERPERACLDYHIGRCKAPCILAQSQEDYRAMIDEVVLFLDGRADEVIRRVRDRMDDAARSLDFERAAELRDALRHLERMEEPTIVLEVEGADRDVDRLRARRGRRLCRDPAYPQGQAAGARSSVRREHRRRRRRCGAVGISGANVRDVRRARVGAARPVRLRGSRGDRGIARGTRVVAPQRGPRRELVDLAQQNARHLLEELKLSTLESEERATNPVYELGRELGLQRLPRSLVCFDISTAQGTDTVGSCVWFENGRPRRAEYRKFKVKSVVGTDDFASMSEVVGRTSAAASTRQKPLPDLVVVIDGGKGQLGAAPTPFARSGSSRCSS